jgi:hypothetical protein
MFGHKRRAEDEIGPSKGIMKVVNRLLRFVLYPFMHPFKFFVIVVVVLIVLIGIPSYLGITFDGIGSWYGEKFVTGYEQAKAWSEENLWVKVAQYLPSKEQDSTWNHKVLTEETAATKADLVAYDAPKAYERRVFSQEQEAPVDVAGNAEQNKMSENTPQEPESVSEDDETAQPAEHLVFNRKDFLKLIYLDQPQELRGVVQVVNANELRIGDTYVLLYGIYVAPKSSLGRRAMQYLERTFAGKEVYCQIGAYTPERTATAICLCEGVNINQKLVDLAYSKDVSLN